MFKGLNIDIPACVPVYDQYPSNALQTLEPVEYRYISLPTTLHKNLEAYVVHNYDFTPTLADGDILVVDRNQTVNSGDTIAGFIDGFLQVGRLRKIGDELWIENRLGRTYLQNNQLAGVIITIEKSQKNASVESSFN
jgi:SOS-response transcriptional repressor LexA